MYMSLYIDICIYIDMHIYMCVGIFIQNCNCILCIFKKENEINLDYNFCKMYAIIYVLCRSKSSNKVANFIWELISAQQWAYLKHQFIWLVLFICIFIYVQSLKKRYLDSIKSKRILLTKICVLNTMAFHIYKYIYLLSRYL